MSARLEALQEQLVTIKAQIATRIATNQSAADLLCDEKEILEQLTRARMLLTEGKAVLKG